MVDNGWSAEFIYLFRNHKMADEIMSLYNAQMQKKLPEEGFDRISDPIPMGDDGIMKKTGYCYWVHVSKQSEDVTESIKKVCEWEIPEGYNNIIRYVPSQKMWELKFACC